MCLSLPIRKHQSRTAIPVLNLSEYRSDQPHSLPDFLLLHESYRHLSVLVPQQDGKTLFQDPGNYLSTAVHMPQEAFVAFIKKEKDNIVPKLPKGVSCGREQRISYFTKVKDVMNEHGIVRFQ